jgi:hypothetical protein
LNILTPTEKLTTPDAPAVENVVVPVILKLDVNVTVYPNPFNVKLFQFTVDVFKVVDVETDKVEPVVTTVPAVYVKFPVSNATVPEIVSVPTVLIVILFLITDAPDQVPVLLKIIAEVPAVAPPFVTELILATLMVLLFNVVPKIPLRDNVPVIKRLLLIVKVFVVPLKVIFAQEIPFVLSVVDSLQFRVEPVVITVPAV